MVPHMVTSRNMKV